MDDRPNAAPFLKLLTVLLCIQRKAVKIAYIKQKNLLTGLSLYPIYNE